MAVRGVVFDIGGVLEITPDTGMTARWETRLRLRPGALDQRLAGVWKDGSLGNLSEEDVRRSLGAILGLDQAQADAFMQDAWDEYLGEPNVELTAYFAGLRPRYRTALLSNSFVGAREREQERYHVAEMTDLIVYSHEVGLAKPDPRIFALTCERLGMEPGDIVFLDDVEAHIAAARDLGIHAVLFRNTTQAIADVQDCLQTHAS